MSTVDPPMAEDEDTFDEPEPSGFEKLLGLFTDVKAGEGVTALLLVLNVLLLLTAYYVIKPVRDALITGMPGGKGDVYKSYMGGAIAVALLFAVPAYTSFAKKLPRNRLVVGAILFFVSNIVLFALGTTLPNTDSWLPLVFYLWVGIFNMMVVAQFWAFANDIYDEEQGKRLFPLVGIGASFGAVVGGALAKFLPVRPESNLQGGCSAVTKQVGYLDTFSMLLVSGGILVICALLTQMVHKRELVPKQRKKIKSQLKVTMSASADDMKEAVAKLEEKAAAKKTQEANKDQSQGAFAMVFRYRYLILLAAFSLLFTFANTNGEYMIGNLVKKHVFSTVGQCEFADEATKKAFISGMFTSWYGDFYLYVNIVGVLLQSFAVSRVVKWAGLKAALFVFPIVALLGASAVLLLPALAVLRTAKIGENATDYSFNNTVRNMLWLPTTKAMKYQAKQAVDTFFVRMGDVSSALMVFVVVDLMAIKDVRIFAATNLLVVVGVILVARALLKEQHTLKEMRDRGELPE
jgi:ATP:ADP antiporter, AAA family